MKVYFNPNMSVDSGGFSPSGSKPALAVADWTQRGLDIEIIDFEPATEADLCLAHDPAFVRGVMSLNIANGHGNRLKSVADSCLWTVGSLMSAARAALTDGITCSPSSGFHHSTHSKAMMYCTYSGLVIAAQKMFVEQNVEKVGILDLDFHWANGSQDCIDKLNLHYRVKHWSFGGEYSGRMFRQEEFLDDLQTVLRDMKSDGCELILYQAGADMWISDPLGGAASADELRERDQFVFKTCSDLEMACCWNLAGGYAKDDSGTITPVLALHRATMEEAIRVLGTRASKA